MNGCYLKNKLDKIKILQNEILKLINEAVDPLFHIRKQIEMKSYNLKKCFYNRPYIVCGLNLNEDRFLSLLSCFNDTVKAFTYPKQQIYHIPKFDGCGDCKKHYIKQLYNLWIRL